MNQTTKYWTKQVKTLRGGIIQRPIAVRDTGLYSDEFWGFEVKLPDGRIKHVWVLQDEEGNGPGALDIVDK